MADIELDDFGNREDREEQPPEDGREDQETTFDDDWRDESILDFDDNPGGEIPIPRKDAGVMRKALTEDKKKLVRELNINVNKDYGPSARSLFERLEVTLNRKGRVNGDILNFFVTQGYEKKNKDGERTLLRGVHQRGSIRIKVPRQKPHRARQELAHLPTDGPEVRKHQGLVQAQKGTHEELSSVR